MLKQKEILQKLNTIENLLKTTVGKLDSIILISKNKKPKCICEKQGGNK